MKAEKEAETITIEKEYIATTIKNLKRNNMEGYYVRNITELHALIQEFLVEGEIIGCGDSVTLEDTKVFHMIRDGKYHFLDKHQEGLTSEEKRKIYIQNFSCNTFLTGLNAVTTDGQLFNIDVNGSRVAPILYGPEQVIAVVGTNKIVKDLDEAIHRSRQIAAPLDAERLKKGTPCTVLKKCIDCHHKNRICNDFVLISDQFVKGRIKVIMIQGDYGY